VEFGTLKIDFNGLAMFITALSAAYATMQGAKQRKKTREKKAELEAEKKDGEENDSVSD